MTGFRFPEVSRDSYENLLKEKLVSLDMDFATDPRDDALIIAENWTDGPKVIGKARKIIEPSKAEIERAKKIMDEVLAATPDRSGPSTSKTTVCLDPEGAGAVAGRLDRMAAELSANAAAARSAAAELGGAWPAGDRADTAGTVDGAAGALDAAAAALADLAGRLRRAQEAAAVYLDRPSTHPKPPFPPKREPPEETNTDTKRHKTWEWDISLRHEKVIRVVHEDDKSSVNTSPRYGDNTEPDAQQNAPTINSVPSTTRTEGASTARPPTPTDISVAPNTHPGVPTDRSPEAADPAGPVAAPESEPADAPADPAADHEADDPWRAAALRLRTHLEPLYATLCAEDGHLVEGHDGWITDEMLRLRVRELADPAQLDAHQRWLGKDTLSPDEDHRCGVMATAIVDRHVFVAVFLAGLDHPAVAAALSVPGQNERPDDVVVSFADLGVPGATDCCRGWQLTGRALDAEVRNRGRWVRERRGTPPPDLATETAWPPMVTPIRLFTGGTLVFRFNRSGDGSRFVVSNIVPLPGRTPTISDPKFGPLLRRLGKYFHPESAGPGDIITDADRDPAPPWVDEFRADLTRAITHKDLDPAALFAATCYDTDTADDFLRLTWQEVFGGPVPER